MFSHSPCSSEVEQAMQDHLRKCFVVNASCEYHDGTLYLQDHFLSFYQEQTVQAAVWNGEGVEAVVNKIEVDP
jgi:hypothetical protein